MSAAHGPESFTRLEEFPSFISSIKSFGRPIHPPLLTPSRRHELREFRVAAMNKEAEILKRKNEILKQRQAKISFESHERDDILCVHSDMQESCALWCPSSKDNQEGISIAISKLPTYGIYSSVHTGAIVCSNVIGKSHAYSPRITRDSLSSSEENAVDCIKCSKSNINPECSLCQAEHKHSFYKSFATEESPEVPCRTFSLVHQNFSTVDTELNSTEEETEGVSLPTVICNEKYISHDTDSESNITFMSQSTDLEKYMGHSCEFSSPDNSAIIWDSKSISQQGTLSKSDDASSETIVNTENELTPCASTMAEFTENIEDELSNGEEAANISDTKNLGARTLKRSYSVDSYMKIHQSCTKNMNVKKSLSEPFNTNQETTLSSDNTKIAVTSKSSLLIKEDSKESEESKDLLTENVFQDDETTATDIKTTELPNDKNSLFKKKHVRQNSYTLDHPSSALVLAHADCTCNLDVNCLSPHCSALKDEITPNPDLTKEKVEISSASSCHQTEKLPNTVSENSVDNVNLNKEDLTSAVIDDFPVVKEDSSEKSCSENLKMISESVASLDCSSVEAEDQSKSANKNISDRLSESLFSSVDAKHEANLQKIYQEFCENYEKKCKELEMIQQQQWLQLKEEFKEKEKLLHDNLKLVLASTGSQPVEKDQITNDKNVHGDEKTSEMMSVSEKEMSVSATLSRQIPSSDNSILQNASLAVLSESAQPACSYDSSVLQNSRASYIHTGIHPSKDNKSPNLGLSVSSENFDMRQLSNNDMNLADNNSFESNKDCVLSSREPIPIVSNLSSVHTLEPHFVSLPQTPKAIAVPLNQYCNKMPTCFCGSSVQQCKCCASAYSYPESEYFQILPPGYIPPTHEQNSALYAKDFVNHCDCSQNSSAPSGFQTKGLDHESSFNSSNETNPSSFQNSRKSSLSPQNVSKTRELYKNLISIKNGEVHQNALFSAIGNGDLLHNKESNDTKLHSLKEKSGLFEVSSIGSSYTYTKTLMNGNHISEDGAHHKKIIIDPSAMKRFQKLPAFVKGYLTRRLFKTEHVQGLIKTLTDSYILIDELGKELDAKGKCISQRDVDFHRQLYVQLLTTYRNFYDVFFTITTSERMHIIAESRNYRLNQKHRNKNQESNSPVRTSASEPTLTRKLSSASLKYLERKNKKRSSIDSRTYNVADYKNLRSRSAIDMRTYIIDNLPSFRERTHSSMSSKSSISLSPSSIYTKGVSIPLKRKTASVRSSSQQSHHPKWVP